MNDKTHTDIDGQNGYKDLIPLDVHMNGGMKYTYEVEFGVVHEGWQNPYRYNARYAVLIGGGDTESSKNYPAYWKDTKSMYNNLVNNYNYRAGNVYLHFWDHKNLNSRVFNNEVL